MITQVTGKSRQRTRTSLPRKGHHLDGLLTAWMSQIAIGENTSLSFILSFIPSLSMGLRISMSVPRAFSSPFANYKSPRKKDCPKSYGRSLYGENKEVKPAAQASCLLEVIPNVVGGCGFSAITTQCALLVPLLCAEATVLTLRSQRLCFPAVVCQWRAETLLGPGGLSLIFF